MVYRKSRKPTRKPMSTRKNKRRTYKKRYNKPVIRSVPVQQLDCVNLKLNYYTIFSSSGTGQYNTVMRLNSLYDPDYSGGGH